jgi:hypothetical protein
MGLFYIYLLLVRFYIWVVALCGAETWTLRKIDKKIPGKFLCQVTTRDGEDQLDR